MLRYTLTLLVILGMTMYSTAQELQWAVNFAGDAVVLPQALDIDGSGNSYVVGKFEGTVDFDPGPGVHEISANGELDGFIAKYSEVGELLWAHIFAHPEENSQLEIGSVAIDDQGNSYLVGRFNGEVIVNPGEEELIFESVTDGAYLIKYSSDSNFEWAHEIDGDGVCAAVDILVDQNGDLAITGYFNSTVDFDPGPESVELTAGLFFQRDGFIMKMSDSGELLWVKQFGGNADVEPTASTIDPSGNILITGRYEDFPGDFDPGEGEFILDEGEMFVSKLDSLGNFIWAKGFGYGSSHSLEIDDEGNAYIQGIFTATSDFDPGPDEFNMTSFDDLEIFISKLNSDGNFEWAKEFNVYTDEFYSSWCESIQLNSSGSVISAGAFRSTIDLDPGEDTLNVTPSFDHDGYLNVLDSEGNLEWNFTIGGDSSSVFIRKVALDDSGNVFITGQISGSSDFSPGPDTQMLSSNDNGGFIAKYSPSSNFDCPDHELNVGDPCDDGNIATLNDIVIGSCNCQGEVTPCSGDFDENQLVSTSDLFYFLAEFGCQGNCEIDFNNDQQVDSTDLLIFLSNFGIECF